MLIPIQLLNYRAQGTIPLATGSYGVTNHFTFDEGAKSPSPLQNCQRLGE